jgi:hypothetical protein
MRRNRVRGNVPVGSVTTARAMGSEGVGSLAFDSPVSPNRSPLYPMTCGGREPWCESAGRGGSLCLDGPRAAAQAGGQAKAQSSAAQIAALCRQTATERPELVEVQVFLAKP